MTAPWDPTKEADRLDALARITAAMLHGRAIREQRLDELGGGYPTAGGNGTGNADNGGPTAANALARIRGGRLDEHGNPLPVAVDVAHTERVAWERDLRKALEHAAALWAQHLRLGQLRDGAPKLTDPGCELCAQVPCDNPKCRCSAIDGRHYCPTRYTVEVVDEPKPNRKGTAPTVRLVGVCSSCYEFQRADRAGRLPDHGEVLDHVEGRRRRYSVRQQRPA
ncbi:MAG: hypothetical protein LC798_20995 [Chloroflexi bacterium]|nr:hypothetical protein [Chloroflexota bacterium]